MAGFDFLEGEIHANGFVVAGVGYAVAEGAAFGWVDGGRDVALEEDFFAFHLGIGHGDGGEEGFGVGVFRVAVDGFRIGQLHDFPEIHDGDAVADVFYHGEIVGDEKVGEIELFLQINEEVEDLGLDGNVEGGDWFIADQPLGFQGQA